MLSFKSFEDCRKYMDDEEIRQFDVKFCDLLGSWHHITLLKESLDANIIEKGVGFDSSSIPRFRDVRQGDMMARPDLASCFIDTTFDEKTLSSVCDIVEAGTGAESVLDPRSVLKRALGYFSMSGIGDRITCAPELEFYLFASAGFMNDPYAAMYRIGAPGVGRPHGDDSLGASERVMEGRGYMGTHPQDWWQNHRTMMADKIAEMGLPVRYHHREVGAAGQQEIEFGFMDALRAADGILLGKYFIRDIAVDNGIEACFMPKPIANAAGNGQHIHFRLYKDDVNLFAGDGYGGLSDTAKHFIGGILSHGRSLLAITSPSTNSYRRLRPGHETPTRFFYSIANREAAIRIPKYSAGIHTRCEFRPGDPMMNPYLAISAIIMAGLDGIKNKIDPTPIGLGPFDGHPDELDPNEHPECFLPRDLREALECLEHDNDYLQEGGVFDELMIRNFLAFKRQEEVYRIAGTPHPLEFEMYWGV